MARRWGQAGLLALGIVLLLSGAGAARPVYLCERPDGGISVTNFPAAVAADPAQRAQAIERTRRLAGLPAASQCWEADHTTLPARTKPDPRHATERLSQRHQWRRGAGNAVVIDATVKQPHGAAFRRAVVAIVPPGRQAVIAKDSQGGTFLRAVAEQDWPLVRALLPDLETRGIVTPAEVSAIRAAATDYDLDL